MMEGRSVAILVAHETDKKKPLKSGTGKSTKTTAGRQSTGKSRKK
jgi:hypothetical protein